VGERGIKRRMVGEKVEKKLDSEKKKKDKFGIWMERVSVKK
jgi:hypothetical protein